jgi:hypothetical protein
MNKGESRPSTGTSLHGLYQLHEFQPRYPTLISKKFSGVSLKVMQLMQVMQADPTGSKDHAAATLPEAANSHDCVGFLRSAGPRGVQAYDADGQLIGSTSRDRGDYGRK